jgi:hypothetical protein
MPLTHLASHFPERDAPYEDRLARLGRALIAMSRDLAESRRRIVTLERENAALRERLHAAREG